MLPNSAVKLSEITGGYFKSLTFGEQPISKVFTDTRKIYADPNAVFVALKGPNYDGHNFLLTAYKKGLRQFIVQQFSDELPEDAAQLKVKDSLFALHQWAVFVRKQFFGTVIGVTGSNGKTMFKEWLATLVEEELPIFKNPKSYNSQLGVPLSILPLNINSAMAVFEAGISTTGEMERLERLIRPKIGVFTHLGSAHDEGFESRQQKFEEKLKLFQNAKTLILPDTIWTEFQEHIEAKLPETKIIRVGKTMDSDYRVITQTQGDQTQLVIRNPEEFIFKIPFTDTGSVQNLLLVIVCYLQLKLPIQGLQKRLDLLRAIPMRQQFSRTHTNAIIINDSYSLDWESLEIALDFLDKQAVDRKKVLIISDFPDQGNKEAAFDQLKTQIEARGLEKVYCVGPDFHAYQPIEGAVYFQSTEEFIHQLPQYNFEERAVLIKGARKFQLEKLALALQSQRHQTILEINLSAILRNFESLRLQLQPKTKIMAMVKAAAYGGGHTEVANILESQGVDYIGVAFTQEGRRLREAGIKCPILVLNPWMDEADEIIQNQLTPAIYRLENLQHLNELAKKSGKKVPVHLKLETGMNRLGFEKEEFKEILPQIQALTFIEVEGIYSHLAAADESNFDAFTQEQVSIFTETADFLESSLNKKLLKHLANTAGTLRFKSAHFDMVRLGIGLYGYNPTKCDPQLELAMQLKSTVSQIKTLKIGQSAGYSRKFIADKETRIAIIPLGYADGLPRSSGNYQFKVLFPDLGFAPIVGNVCMDMCMIDIGELPVKEGDTVVIFGPEHPIETLATANNTIPYEILARISERVKRVYFED